MRPMRIIGGLAHRLAQKITTSILCTRWLLRPWWVPCELYLGAWLTFASAGAPVVQRKSASAFGFELLQHTASGVPRGSHTSGTLGFRATVSRALSLCRAAPLSTLVSTLLSDGALELSRHVMRIRVARPATYHFYSPGHRRRVQTMHV